MTLSNELEEAKLKREEAAKVATTRLANINEELKALMTEAVAISESFEIEFYPSGFPNGIHFGRDYYYGDNNSWTWLSSSSTC